MKKIFILIAGVAALMLVGCATPMDINKTIDPLDVEGSADIPNMEFIGFKADASALGTTSYEAWRSTQQSAGLKNLGARLQVAGIAVDQSYGYFGIYSFQELEAYKSTKRYVTFVEVQDQNLIYTSDKASHELALSYGFLILPLFYAMTPYHTTTTLKGTYNIYVFDTVSRTIKYKDMISVHQTDTWEGSWADSTDAEFTQLYDYYGAAISNAILEKYTGIQKFLAGWE